MILNYILNENYSNQMIYEKSNLKLLTRRK